MSSAHSTYQFTLTDAYNRLRSLAFTAFDLTAPGALTPERVQQFRASACGFDLLYATQAVDSRVMEGLAAIAETAAAQEQLRQMAAGAVINRIEGHESENRRVLHTASRDVFDDLPTPKFSGGASSRKKKGGSAAVPDNADALQNARRELEKLRDFTARIESGALANAQGQSFTDLVNIGIGGSDLGPRAMYLALLPFTQGGRRVHFISNVDPDDTAQVLGGLDLSRTLINVVSKSGATLETLTNENLARAAYEKAGLDPLRHFLCVTGEGSPMDNPARFLASFYMFDYIGGRYSATSMVGGVLLAFAYGSDGFSEFLRGAREMDLHAMTAPPQQNLPLLAALLGIWNHNFLRYHTLAVLPYSQALIRFTAHLQQLDMESNGKRITRRGVIVDYGTGPVVWGEPGTNGQHAFYQLIHQGPSVIPCEFIGFRQSQSGLDLSVQDTTSQQKLLANLLAQSVGLATGNFSENPNRTFPGNRPNSVLIAERLTPRTLGALLAYYEHKVALQGLIWNINSFDQEGVQLGKVLANQYIDHFKAINAGKSPAKGAQADPTGLALFKAAGLV